MTQYWTKGLLRLVGGLLLLNALIPATAQASAIITHGETALGVNPHGHLNVGLDSVPLPAGFVDPRLNSFIGLLRNGVGDAISPGCQCEGWGVAVSLELREAGTAGIDNLPGISGLGPAIFGSTASTATSIVDLEGAPLRVEHHYGPSPAPDVLLGRVTLTNTGMVPLDDVVYRRAMDWDVPPTEFFEFVTHQGVAANLVSAGGNVLLAHNNGFNTLDPRSDDGERGAPQGTTLNVDFDTFGPTDHGSNFAFGTLLPGQARSFDIYYGTAPDEAGALARLALLGAEVYSLGFSTLDFSMEEAEDFRPCTSCPTFLFAFRGIGGEEPGLTPENPVLPFVPAPGEFVFPAPIPRRWYDPPFADGFLYSLSAGEFLEVGLPPTLFPGLLDLPYGPVSLWIGGSFITLLNPGDSFMFDPTMDVTSFLITGITPLLDVADPAFANAFPTFLDFTVVAGQQLTMTAQLVPPPHAIPEPSSFLLLGSGLVGLVCVWRRRRPGARA